MAAYNNPESGCFHGDCYVTLSDGTKRKVRVVQKGDIVVVGRGGKVVCTSGPVSCGEVVCVVESLCGPAGVEAG